MAHQTSDHVKSTAQGYFTLKNSQKEGSKGKHVGRPKRVIDLTLAEKLGQLQCTYSECASFLEIPEQTLKKNVNFRTAYKKGFESGKISIRRAQFKLMEKNTAMAIWLGKQYLGQKEQGLIDAKQDAFSEVEWVELK